MSPILLLASLVGQLATPQSRSVETAPGPSQTLVLLQYTPPPIPGATSILVSNPPAWDRVLKRTGEALIARAAKHQHPQVLQVVAQAPATTMQTVALVPITAPAPVTTVAVPIPPAAAPVSVPAKTIPTAVPVTAKPVTYAIPSAQSEAAPPPPSPSCVAPAPAPPPLTPTVPLGSPVLLVPDPTRQQQIHHYFTLP
jgi:hypothetical protein